MIRVDGGGEIDEGELRWNGAVQRGGLALLDARKQGSTVAPISTI